MATPKKEVSIRVDTMDFIDRLKKMKPFMSREATRYYLCGILMRYAKENLTMVATNGHILCEMVMPTKMIDIDGEFSVILPDFAVDNLLAMLKNVKSHVGIGIKTDGKTISFDPLDFTYTVKATDGKYPDYEKVIPEPDATVTTGFNSDYLKSAFSVFNNEPFDVFRKDAADSAAPHLIKSNAAKGVRVVIMPMRM